MMQTQIKKIALELGFDQIGFTSLWHLKEGDQALKDWIQDERHGSMKYLEDFEARRQRFLRDFPDAHSVIVLGVNYYSGTVMASEPKQSLISGRVARYAWGQDYHEVIRQKHGELITRMNAIAPSVMQAKSCVDIQPIPERFSAAKAGLGFVGKNTMLLSQKFGPWLFLSEIVTNLELEEDAALDTDCGTCTHCQRACPTGALDQDYNMDARKCIAYLTIEHKGSIPVEIRPKIKDWIFGCDECLTICPFTSKGKQTKWPEFHPENGKGEWLFIEKLFDLKSNREYENEFRGTALMRASRKQMLRNACIVLGNSGDERALPLLEKGLQDISELVREHAAWGIEQIKKNISSSLQSEIGDRSLQTF